MPPLSSLEKFYDWRQAQCQALAKGCFSLAGLIFSPLLAAVLNGPVSITAWQVRGFAEGALLAFWSGILWNDSAMIVQEEFFDTAQSYSDGGDEGP